MTQSLDYDALGALLRRIGFADEAAEYHGALCGALCVRDPREIDMLRLLDVEQPDAATAELRQGLDALRTATLEALGDEDMSFAPLLPDDDAALVPRVQALGAWCQGFLYGLASRPGLDLERCSADLREIVHDFTELTQASVGDETDSNIEEAAYTELVEYLRVGAQLVFMELHPRPTLDPADSQHLH